MKIFLHNYKVIAKKALKIVGYKYRIDADDYIYLDGIRGRFHAKILDPQTADIHYDLFVEDRHFAPDVPLHTKKEKYRIFNNLNRRGLKSYEMTEEKFKKLLSKY